MSENLINPKICKGCRQRVLNEFLSKNNEMKATCNDCRERNGASKRQIREKNITENITEVLSHKENAISLQQLPGVIYESLLVADSSNTLSEEKTCKKNAEKIFSLASEGDGYQYLNVSEIYHEIKEQQLPGYELLTRGQVYYWWNRQATTEPTESFAFITPFLSLFPHDAFEIIVTDATYNTNTSKYELYEIMGVINGTAFPLSYCLVVTGKNRPIANILAGWYTALKIIGMNNMKVFLTDKDMAQISAAVLKHTNNVQL
ncbi:hypothetical protein C1645_878967 [Glomus cerebriforme]|uniref:MULE transposase domain-containing protein n=1 Tax=Glomus cerebriforme TaxID=658196 RepID=A0A397SPY2_9GLOM|nr:hypothetical protein C1645_878967 [Glomus cerebriforme]